MKFEIEMKDFWLDEDDNLEEVLKQNIISGVVSKIQKNIADRVETQIQLKVDKLMSKKIASVIDDLLDNFVAEGEIDLRNGREKISIEDHLRSKFNSNNGWSNPERQMEALAKKFGEEMKLQYNGAFANKIITNMNKQGLLKDEVVKLLFDDSQK